MPRLIGLETTWRNVSAPKTVSHPEHFRTVSWANMGPVIVHTFFSRVFCTKSRFPQEHEVLEETNLMTGGFGNNAAGDVSIDNCLRAVLKTFRARAPQSASFFLNRVARKGARSVPNSRSHFCFGKPSRPTARSWNPGSG